MFLETHGATRAGLPQSSKFLLHTAGSEGNFLAEITPLRIALGISIRPYGLPTVGCWIVHLWVRLWSLRGPLCGGLGEGGGVGIVVFLEPHGATWAGLPQPTASVTISPKTGGTILPKSTPMSISGSEHARSSPSFYSKVDGVYRG